MIRKLPKPVSMDIELYERVMVQARRNDVTFSRFVCECLSQCVELLEGDSHDYRDRLGELLSRKS